MRGDWRMRISNIWKIFLINQKYKMTVFHFKNLGNHSQFLNYKYIEYFPSNSKNTVTIFCFENLGNHSQFLNYKYIEYFPNNRNKKDT